MFIPNSPEKWYVLTQCPQSYGKCGKQYAGETKAPLNIRMNGHRDDWRHKKFERSPVGEHFCSSGHDFLSHASVCCLESNPEETDNAVGVCLFQGHTY